MSLLFLLVVLIGGGMFGSGVVAHDYSGALSNSILFFEGQRSGVLPQDLGVVLQLPLLHFIATHSQRDSSVLAQLGWPDMRLPILYTINPLGASLINYSTQPVRLAIYGLRPSKAAS